MGRHKADVPRKILPSVQDCSYPEGDLWNLTTLWGNTAQVLGGVQQVVRLLMMNRNMVDAASGGALMDKTPTTARHLISNMVSNTINRTHNYVKFALQRSTLLISAPPCRKQR
ncbi:hypothetical protein CR513_25970, partial [Mucuna pruriens]